MVKEFLDLILAQSLAAVQLACLALYVEKEPLEDQLGLKALPVHPHWTLVLAELLILLQHLIEIISINTFEYRV